MDFSLLENLRDVVYYPFNFVQVLIQIGHEPIAPVLSSSLFRGDKYYLPNRFQYIRYVRSLDGLSGLYRGFGMRVIGNTVGTVIYSYVAQIEEEAMERELEMDMNKHSIETEFEFFERKCTKEITATAWAIAFSHPFHIMSLRCISQFVGNETRYSSWNLYQNALEIYRTEGLSGFFDGFIPRLLFQISTIILANTIAYQLRQFSKNEEKIVKYTDTLSSVLAFVITSPLSVVTTISSISGSELVAATPPNMPRYRSWISVLNHLYENNGLMRGMAVFFRESTPVIKYTGDMIY